MAILYFNSLPSLDVPGLAENRPSVLVGTIIFLSTHDPVLIHLQVILCLFNDMGGNRDSGLRATFT